MDKLTDIYYRHICEVIDPDGFKIPHGLIRKPDGGVIVIALAVDPGTAYEIMLAARLKYDSEDAIFALDRFALPDQGTTMNDLLGGHYYHKDFGWKPFIIEYRYEPRFIKEMQWDNIFWNIALNSELRAGINSLADKMMKGFEVEY